MIEEKNLVTLPLELRKPLFREQMLAQGRYDAFLFALKCQGDTTQIKAEIKWYEDVLADPSNTAPDQPYAPNTSVRLRAEGYLSGLKDALKILQAASGNGSAPESA